MLRNLMKERQLAKRIDHPFARYVGNKLTCTLCNGMAVKSEALWPSHITSKSHRLNAQKHREANEAKQNAAAAVVKGKRRADEALDQDEDDTQMTDTSNSTLPKRSRLDNVSKELVESGPSSSLPADFFDDPSQAPPPRPPSPPPVAAEPDDPEWANFEAMLNEATTTSVEAALSRATIVGEPVMFEEWGDGDALKQQEVVEEEEEEVDVETEEDKRMREEKEEIMERIEAEEREQAEADERVSRMKARIEALRAARRT